MDLLLAYSPCWSHLNGQYVSGLLLGRHGASVDFVPLFLLASWIYQQLVSVLQSLRYHCKSQQLPPGENTSLMTRKPNGTLECNCIIFEVKNSLESLKYRLGMAEEKIQQKISFKNVFLCLWSYFLLFSMSSDIQMLEVP